MIGCSLITVRKKEEGDRNAFLPCMLNLGSADPLGIFHAQWPARPAPGLPLLPPGVPATGARGRIVHLSLPCQTKTGGAGEWRNRPPPSPAFRFFPQRYQVSPRWWLVIRFHIIFFKRASEYPSPSENGEVADGNSGYALSVPLSVAAPPGKGGEILEEEAVNFQTCKRETLTRVHERRSP